MLYYFVMYITPGPNNAMVLTSGIKFGFQKTITHILGITSTMLKTVIPEISDSKFKTVQIETIAQLKT